MRIKSPDTGIKWSEPSGAQKRFFNGIKNAIAHGRLSTHLRSIDPEMHSKMEKAREVKAEIYKSLHMEGQNTWFKFYPAVVDELFNEGRITVDQRQELHEEVTHKINRYKLEKGLKQTFEGEET